MYGGKYIPSVLKRTTDRRDGEVRVLQIFLLALSLGLAHFLVRPSSSAMASFLHALFNQSYDAQGRGRDMNFLGERSGFGRDERRAQTHAAASLSYLRKVTGPKALKREFSTAFDGEKTPAKAAGSKRTRKTPQWHKRTFDELSQDFDISQSCSMCSKRSRYSSGESDADSDVDVGASLIRKLDDEGALLDGDDLFYKATLEKIIAWLSRQSPLHLPKTADKLANAIKPLCISKVRVDGKMLLSLLVVNEVVDIVQKRDKHYVTVNYSKRDDRFVPPKDLSLSSLRNTDLYREEFDLIRDALQKASSWALRHTRLHRAIPEMTVTQVLSELQQIGYVAQVLDPRLLITALFARGFIEEEVEHDVASNNKRTVKLKYYIEQEEEDGDDEDEEEDDDAQMAWAVEESWNYSPATPA